MENSDQIKYSVAQGIKESKPWFATIREDYEILKGKQGLDWLLEIHIGIEGLDRPLPSKEEADVLNQFEDMFEEILKETAIDAYFIARTTWDGLRSIYYRVSEPELTADRLEKLIKSRGNPREFEYKITRDLNWKVMSEIFPVKVDRL